MRPPLLLAGGGPIGIALEGGAKEKRAVCKSERAGEAPFSKQAKAMKIRKDGAALGKEKSLSGLGAPIQRSVFQ
jgi:hypothetical protein